MKSRQTWVIYLVLLAFLVGCGKDNESGKGGAVPLPSVMNPFGVPVTNTPYAFQGVNLSQVMAQNPCISGYSQMTGMTGVPSTYNGHRVTIQVPLTGFNSVVPPGDIYVGVTSYGDVAAVVGQAVGQPPLFVAYLCPRSFAPQGQGQLQGVNIGAKSPTCLFKPITAATVVFPGGATADFRWLDGGTSMRTPFRAPVCLNQ